MATATYVLSLTPRQPTQVRNLFQLGAGHVSEVLERPAPLRWAGWDMTTLDQAHIVNGECLELNNGPRKTIRLFEDGTLLVQGAIDGDFLGWGTRESGFENDPRVHALATIEFTTTFVRLYGAIIPFLENKPAELNYHLEIRNGKVNDKYLYLLPFPVNSIGYMFRDEPASLTTDNPQYDGVISAKEVLEDPDRSAFRLTERLFLFFGIATNKIPYTREESGVFRVDTDKIKNVK
jgi:hypothetical protein